MTSCLFAEFYITTISGMWCGNTKSSMRKSRLLRYIPAYLNVCCCDVFVVVASTGIIVNTLHFNKYYFSPFGLCLHTLCPIIINQENVEHDTAYPFQSSAIKILTLSLYKLIKKLHNYHTIALMLFFTFLIISVIRVSNDHCIDAWYHLGNSTGSQWGINNGEKFNTLWY